MTITAQQLVDREVYYCVSQLVHELAQKGDEQASELFYPVPEYDAAAIDAGWYRTNKTDPTYWRNDSPETDGYKFGSAQEVCEEYNIEPYYREIFEHWIISNWLADKLEAHGEKVDRDFYGLTIWARTTTGQAISIDGVIEQIAAELNQKAA